MFPPGAFAVGVSVAAPDDGLPVDGLPPDPEPWPARLGELLPVAGMTAGQIAAHLQQVQQAARAELAAFEAELIVGLAERRPAAADRRPGQPGAASGEWAAEVLEVEVSEFFADELALIQNCSRTQATVRWERSATLRKRLPATWAALADGRLDRPRADALAAELGWPARETPDAVLAAVEAAVLPQASGLSVTRLRERARAELIAADPAAAERRRRRAQREADVTVRGLGDGMGELRGRLPYPDAAAVRARVDAVARAAKAAGDARPLGQLRAQALHDLVTHPDGEQPGVSAHVQVVAPLDTLESAAAAAAAGEGGAADVGGEPGAESEPATVDGQPVTAAQLRELLERIDALCPGGLQAPTGGSLAIALVDAAGRLLASATRRELEAAARRGLGLSPPPAVDRYQPSPAQRRFVKTRDRGCRHPGCAHRAGWADLDHVIAHAAGGETDCTNLCCLCRRHHRLKTHARGWRYAMTADGVLSVTTPSGITRTSRPPGMPPPDDDPPPF
jgi:Domain of unknown function (DUF222)